MICYEHIYSAAAGVLQRSRKLASHKCGLSR